AAMQFRRARRCSSRGRAAATRTPRKSPNVSDKSNDRYRMTGIDLEAHLRERRAAGRKLLVPYVTGGLGREWCDVVRAVIDAGADAVEVGIPFSDPIMDGRTIQESSQRALDLGATPDGVITAMGGLDVAAPTVVMTYYNLVYR